MMKITIFVIIFSTLSVIILSAPNTDANAKWNVNFNKDGSDASKYHGEWKGKTYYASPDDWRKESIYQFVTDRFADGDPSNNDGKYGGYDLYSVGGRHGGDFKGIKNKLDYIKTLGFTSIWISPIFQNMENSYHGYAQIDFTLLDDRWGTLEELRDLVSEAHKRDIKVIVDIVVNHMADLFYFEGHKDSNAPFTMHDGEYRLFWRDESRQYADFKIDNNFQKNGQYCPVYKDGIKQVDSGQGSFWLSDFHHNGNLNDYGGAWENDLGKIYGIMDDLRTTHPRVQDKIIAMTKSLIASTDIDGIRMDTPMQVPLDFFKRWVPAVKEYAASLGKKNFVVFAEFYCSKQMASVMTGRGKTPDMYGQDKFIDNTYTFDGGIHYPLYYWLNTTINEAKNNVKGIMDIYKGDYVDYDWWNPRSKKLEYRHFHFFNNHDQWRMAATISDGNGFKKTQLCAALLAFWPGVPLFYYGDEQGFLTKATALDGYSREDFMTSLAWKQFPTVNGKNPANGDNFDMSNTYFLFIQKVMNIRNIYPAFQGCDTLEEKWVQSGNTNGIYAYMRKCGSDTDWALVIFNTWKDPIDANGLKTGWNPQSKVVNVLNEKESYDLKAEGKFDKITLNGFEIKVFVLEKGKKPLNLTIQQITPAHDQAIVITEAKRGEVPISINFSEDVDSSSLIVQFNGNRIPNASLKLQGSSLTFNVKPSDGVNFISLDQSAKSKSTGKTLNGKFISRFRYGLNDNIIINDEAISSSKLYKSINGNKITLNHQALGAEKMRVLFVPKNSSSKSSWSSWSPFTPSSEHSLPSPLAGLKDISEIQVQYYVDNSAAYYVKQSTSLSFIE